MTGLWADRDFLRDVQYRTCAGRARVSRAHIQGGQVGQP